MKLSTRSDVEAPIEFVFLRLTDFASFERQAMRRGIKVTRGHLPPDDGAGIRWDATFNFRGKERQLRASVAQIDAPNLLSIKSISTGVHGDMTIELLPLSRQRTRIKVGLEVRPKTLPARLLVQSLKFGRAKLDARFEQRVADFAKDTGARFQASEKAS